MGFKGLDDINSGYDGYSWSKRASEAYEKGEKPKSNWRKVDIIEELSYIQGDEQVEAWSHAPVAMLKDYCLSYTAYHHTGKYTSKTTDFFRVELGDNFRNLTPNQISKKIIEYKQETKIEREEKKRKEEKATISPDRWECRYLVWSGTRNHPNAKEIRDTGEIKGNWFYPDHASYKKSTNARGFVKVKKIELEISNSKKITNNPEIPAKKKDTQKR